jgi:hypothetical protein
MKNWFPVCCALSIITSCSQPEPEPAQTSPVNTVINKGLNEAVNEVNEQIQDTNSTLQRALDSIDQGVNANLDAITSGKKEIPKAF